MSDIAKTVIAFLYALATLVVPFVDGRHMPTPAEWVTVAIAVTTAVTVYLVPLVAGYAWIKSAVGAILAGLNVLVTVIDGGVSGNDVLMIVIAVAAVLGIYLAPATSPRTGVRVGAGSDTAITV